MRVLMDRYTTIKPTTNKDYPKKITCDECGSDLEYDASDITIGVFGAGHVKCCLCGCNNMLDCDEDGIILTKDNIEYPTHFHHCSANNGAVDICCNEHVKKAINDAIIFFRMNKDKFYWCIASGNMYVIVTRLDGDEEYNIIVTNDYYDSYIPFDNKDY